MVFVLQIIQFVITLFTWLVIINVVLSYFMDPFHPVRRTIDQLLNPLLSPIRRLLPQTGMFDFSPLILIILLQVLEFLLTRLILSVS